ncbi:hypothetical protein HER10_EVM0012150 [Colletotrichum scovillei]|uniref:Alpha-amylase type A isozyme n=1 Tax=Colletotrichum scovillei TaxID=1209932 RepID=A0A9P7QUL7_9PEZI|nr:uncharacterized protein HER10_EVM0012150 [Colletotrichum scovillei]KAF4777179.1 hypothetical protein HER10_EVM0012150 [Colletotrichum scovillei]KAG7038163.1 Alpha-amylase type A isozyme [Colletotrichum scovillei]KAG7040506.1 Alpha-amylase type A isozyme [Colletotrichum scovillei]KAG7060554.1 Alpha-amylase type A isozyme [Colletotrichum scovillei]
MVITLSQASAGLRDLKSRVSAEAVHVSELSDDDVYESEQAKKESLETIQLVQNMIRQSLEEHEDAKKRVPKQDSQALDFAGVQDPNQSFQDATQNNLRNVAQVAGTMSGSIQDIMSNFNSILGLAGIEQFSATLESVPAVGILDNTVQYMAVTLDPATSQTQPAWSLLDTLPASPSGTDTAALFSYNGIFFVAVGPNVWQKTPKPPGDPSLAMAAVDNWSQMFYPGWQPLGSCLPVGDSLCLAPYNNVAPDGTTTYSALIKLASDGTLSWAQGAIAANMNFQPLLPVGNIPMPALLKIAYWNGSLWGHDAANVIHEIKPALAGSGSLTGYTVGQTFQSPKQIKDFTAVDTGIIILADDGFLYELIINPPKDNASPPTVTWNQSIAQGGVTNLSAASPGVILNLRNLTTYLKSQYVTTQTNLFPYINQIQGFCASHKVYLSNLLQAARDWANATTPADKEQIANGEGQVAIQHAQVMGKMLSTSLQAANQMVVDMTRQTSQINNSIANQLANIGQQITDLQATLSALETQEKALTAGIWAAVGAFIVGLGMVIAGFFFPPLAPGLWLLGGILVVGSVVAIGVLASERGKCQAAIAATSTSIQALTQSKSLLVTISGSFTNLAQNYGTLNAFWTSMLSISGAITSLENLGTFLLQDQSSIEAAQQSNQEIIDSLNNYIQVLGSQGIVPPTITPGPPLQKHLSSLDVPKVVNQVASSYPNKDLRKSMQLSLVASLLQSASTQLSTKDTQGYFATIQMAASLNAVTHSLVLL